MLATGVIRDWQGLNVFEIVRHPWFISAFFAGGCAQLVKIALGWLRTRKLRLGYFSEPGGMPSAHSALVTALAVAVGLTDGFDSFEAMIAVGLGIITMADAVSIRWAVGEYVRLLNRIAKRLDDPDGRFEIGRLQERLGHSYVEVFAGIVFGIAVALVVCGFWDFWK